MSRFVGFVLVVAGVGLASSLLLGDSDAEPDAGSGAISGGSPVEPARVASFVPAEQPASSTRPAAAPKVERAELQEAPSAPIVVTITHRTEPLAAIPQKVARVPPDRATLTRELQQELRRAGCYHGELNGVWTPASRKAMKAFTDRVNATLPVENPDYILLSLIQAHEGESCGKPCPPKQGLSEDGRCLPTAVLAHVAKKGTPTAVAASAKGGSGGEKQAPAIAGWTATTTIVASPSRPSATLPEGRMALAGPQVDPPPAVAPTAVAPGLTKPPSAERRTARAASDERRGYARQAYPQRSRFVESVLRSRNSLN
jgi:hypothetical protein